MFSWLLKHKIMLRTVTRLSPSMLIPIFGRRNENDNDELNNLNSTLPKTGLDRVKAMYHKSDMDENSVELHNVSQATLTGLFIGACLGGFIKSRHAYLYFIENNQATIFKSTVEAKKKLQDYVTIAFAKGAYQWGWRLGAFTGMFSLIATTISVYRDQSSLADYIIAGSLTGAIYKATLGPAAMLVGAVLGGVLSTIGGLLILAALKVSGASIADVRRTMYSFREMRQHQMNEAYAKALEEKPDMLIEHHNLIVEDKGVKKIEDVS